MNDVRQASTSQSLASSEPVDFTSNVLMGLGLAALVLGTLWLASQPEAVRPVFSYVGNATIH